MFMVHYSTFCHGSQPPDLEFVKRITWRRSEPANFYANKRVNSNLVNLKSVDVFTVKCTATSAHTVGKCTHGRKPVAVQFPDRLPLVIYHLVILGPEIGQKLKAKSIKHNE